MQRLRFFSESQTERTILLFQLYATLEMRGCLREPPTPVNPPAIHHHLRLPLAGVLDLLLHFGGLWWLGRVVHAARFARFDRGAARQAFQACDLFALLADDLFQAGDFAKHFNQQSLKLRSAQVGEVGWRRHIRKESHRVEPGQAENAGPPTFLPLLRILVAKSSM